MNYDIPHTLVYNQYLGLMESVIQFTQWLFVLEQYAEFGLLFVLQWKYFLQLSEKYLFFSISIILL